MNGEKVEERPCRKRGGSTFKVQVDEKHGKAGQDCTQRQKRGESERKKVGGIV